MSNDLFPLIMLYAQHFCSIVATCELLFNYFTDEDDDDDANVIVSLMPRIPCPTMLSLHLCKLL